MTLGQFIYVFRKSLGLTQEKFSEKLDALEESLCLHFWEGSSKKGHHVVSNRGIENP